MNEIIKTVRSAPVLTPQTFDQLLVFADYASKSGLVPKDYENKPGAVMLAVQMGAELGLSPMQALSSIAVINGRAGVWGDGLIGLCRQSPLCEDIVESFEGTGDGRTAICTAKRKGASPVTATFSVDDAKRANLWGKSIWKQYPDRMLQNRARSFALRDAFPDVLRGLKAAEELIDTPADRPSDWTRSERVVEQDQRKKAPENGTNDFLAKMRAELDALQSIDALRAYEQRNAVLRSLGPDGVKAGVADAVRKMIDDTFQRIAALEKTLAEERRGQDEAPGDDGEGIAWEYDPDDLDLPEALRRRINLGG